MVYLVINKEYINKIYTEYEPEIEMISFNNKEDAEKYINNRNIKVMKVFTDGACSNNGKINAIAGIGIYLGENDKRNISKIINGKQTNNTAELCAVIEVFDILKEEIKDNREIIIYSDSQYVINCCGNFGQESEKNEWKTKKGDYIPNYELVKNIYELFKNNKYVKIEYIKAHTNNNDELSIGNNEADKLAKLAVKKQKKNIRMNTKIEKISMTISNKK